MPVQSFNNQDVSSVTSQLRAASVLLLATLFGGTGGYYWIGEGQWAPLDCLYMTVITLTTVGYGEVLPIEHNSTARAFTIGLLLFGMGVVLYFASAVTAFVLDGELRRVMRRRGMRRQIDLMEGHTILCGVGQTGQHVLKELLLSRAPVVVIDSSPEKLERIQLETSTELLYIIGDATEDDVLLEAGIKRCSGVIVSLGGDHDNLLCTISARTLNPTARIIARGSDIRAEEKFRRAGADQVVYTSVIGGTRIAAEALRPQVVTFLDIMLRDHDRLMRIEQIPLDGNSPLKGLSLRESPLRNAYKLLIIAVYDRLDDHYHHNPPPDFVLGANHTLIALGELHDIEKLRQALRVGRLGT